MPPTSPLPAIQVASSPRLGAVYWTAYSALEGNYEPLDPLRFDMYAQRLGNVLVPGITNRTERLRYLGMVCAGLEETSRPGESIRWRRQQFLPYERGWALAVTVGAGGKLKFQPPGQRNQRLKPEFSGFRGANRVLAYWRTVGGENSMSPTGYRLLSAQESQGGLGAYLVTLRYYGFIHPGTLDLTPRGRELAAAFRHSTPQRLKDLTEVGPVRRYKLERAGADLTIAAATLQERSIGRAALFGGADGTAELMRRISSALGGAVTSPHAGLTAIADSQGDAIGRAANFAVHFDPMRRGLIELFGALGRRLEGRPGPIALKDIVDTDLDHAAAEARTSAASVGALPEIPGLAPISGLARDVAAGPSVEDTVRSTVAFHCREGRAWIVDHGDDRYSAGRHGAFDPPSEAFHGYTVGSALALLRDCEAAA